MPQTTRINLKIDKLTNSLRDAKTGENLATEFRRATARDLAKTRHWLFDWRRESPHSEVYKLIESEAALKLYKKYFAN